jgi:hypothetical protein
MTFNKGLTALLPGDLTCTVVPWVSVGSPPLPHSEWKFVWSLLPFCWVACLLSLYAHSPQINYKSCVWLFCSKSLVSMLILCHLLSEKKLTFVYHFFHSFGMSDIG